MLKPKGVVTPPAVTASFGEDDKQSVSSSGLGESEPFPSQTGSPVQNDEHHARSYQDLFQKQLRTFHPPFTLPRQVRLDFPRLFLGLVSGQ